MYIDNYANYGPNLASYPVTLQYKMSYGWDLDKAIGNHHSLSDGFIEMAPGQKIYLTVNILDAEGRLYVDEQDAVVDIDFVADQVSLAATSVISGREAISSNGVFTFSSLSIRQTPDSTSLIEFKISNLDVFGNKVGFI